MRQHHSTSWDHINFRRQTQGLSGKWLLLLLSLRETHCDQSIANYHLIKFREEREVMRWPSWTPVTSWERTTAQCLQQSRLRPSQGSCRRAPSTQRRPRAPACLDTCGVAPRRARATCGSTSRCCRCLLRPPLRRPPPAPPACRSPSAAQNKTLVKTAQSSHLCTDPISLLIEIDYIYSYKTLIAQWIIYNLIISFYSLICNH